MSCLLLIAPITMLPVKGVCQNLIPNPSFEEKYYCPSGHASVIEPIYTKNWYTPTKGTPDLFSSCALSVVSVPRNFAGIAYPVDGKNYVGMYYGNPRHTVQKNYREYLSCQLLTQLSKGETYHLRFYAKPATNSAYLVDRLTFALTSDSLHADHDHLLSGIAFYTVLTDTVKINKGWYEVEFAFTAKGEEQYLTIGDFTVPGDGSYEAMQNTKLRSNQGTSSYYLFDHFSLTAKQMEAPNDFVTGTPFTLEKVYFGFDSFQLNEPGLIELDKLANYLNTEKHLSLEVYGNTDTKGTREYNEKLSIQRAEAVKAYLINYGIAPQRISAFGLGERDSQYQQDSLNRRTEFMLKPFEKQEQ